MVQVLTLQWEIFPMARVNRVAADAELARQRALARALRQLVPQ